MNVSKNALSALFFHAILGVAVLFNACTEDKETAFTEEENSSYESAEALEQSFDVVSAITSAGLEYVDSENSGRTTVDQEIVCAKLILSGSKEEGKLEINFGAEGCEGPDGRIRKGIVEIEWIGQRFSKGAQIFTVLKNFHIDDMKIEGKRKVTNISESLTEPAFNVEIINGKIIWSDSTYATLQSSRTHNWTIGNEKITISISGSSTGKTRKGHDYTTEIIQPLILESDCIAQRNYLPIKGQKSIATSHINDILVDYGNGSCDQAVTISIGRKSKDVML